MQIVYVAAPVFISFLLNTIVSAAFLGDGSGISRNMTLVSGVSAALTIAVMAYLMGKDRIRIRMPKRKILLPAAFVMGAVLSLAEGWILQISRGQAAEAYTYVNGFYKAPLWMQIVFLGVLVPAAEELTYRVVFYERLHRFIPAAAAAVIGALLFAIGHGNILQALYAFPMALIMSWAYVRGKSAALPVMIHMGANLTAVAVTCLAEYL